MRDNDLQPFTRVVAAVVVRDGRVLCCRRRVRSFMGGRWEFPGGKAGDGEEPRTALVRELTEELGVRSLVGSPVAVAAHGYVGGPSVEITFFDAELIGDPTGDEYEEMMWAESGQMDVLDWLDADVDVARLIARRMIARERVG